MAIEIKVVIPSAGRAGTVTTTRHIDNCILCVPKSELEAYKERNKGVDVVAHPDSVKGLGPKKNWIYNHFGNVFMVDDDTRGLRRMYRRKNVNVFAHEAYDIIQNCGNVAHMAGCFLFGFNKLVNPLAYKGLKPFQFSGYINGAAIGMLEGSLLKFSTEIKCNNDVHVSLINAFYHRKCFIDNRFVIVQEGIAGNTGGTSSFRTQEVEDNDIELLKKNFGTALKIIQRKEGSKRYNISLRIPF